MKSLRLVFFGTPTFSVPTLTRLLEGPHRVVGMVSQPDRARGRGRRSTPSPVAEVALREEIPLLRPERAIECEAELRALEPDLGVVAAFGQFLTKRIRELPTLGYLINAHASLLPKYRGAAPIEHALLDGEAKTGICVMRVEKEMDAGPVALRRELEIAPDETAGELTERLGALAADAIGEAVDQIARGELQWSEQDHGAATLAPKLERGDARIDWSEDAEALAQRVRALAPSPGAVTTLDGEPLRILLARAEADATSCAPGTVERAEDARLRVATGSGWLVPLRVQRAGGKALDIDAYLRGRPIADGARLG